jgi:hypothetical protein
LGTLSGAWQEAYLEFSRKIDAFEDSDQQRYTLGMRACENAARLATNVAVGRGSRTVDREDIAWATHGYFPRPLVGTKSWPGRFDLIWC